MQNPMTLRLFKEVSPGCAKLILQVQVKKMKIDLIKKYHHLQRSLWCSRLIIHKQPQGHTRLKNKKPQPFQAGRKKIFKNMQCKPKEIVQISPTGDKKIIPQKKPKMKQPPEENWKIGRRREKIKEPEDYWDLTHRSLRTLQNSKETSTKAIEERCASDT